MRDFSGCRVTVMGLGRFGGGLGVTRWLVAQGADVTVTDLEPEDALRDSVTELGPLVNSGRVTLRLGGHNVSDFTTCDLVVANPAVPVPWNNRFLRAARAAGIPVTTEIELVVRRLDRRRVIGVTGSMGKSTTAAMIAHVLSRCGQRVLLGGNIGGSLLTDLDAARDEAPRWVVLELSSAMLHWLGEGDAWSPRVAVVTNIADNHKDWHGSFEHYAASKQLILAGQQPGDAAVLGFNVRDWPTRAGVRCFVVPENAASGPLAVPGRHNQVNAAAARLALGALALQGLTDEQIRDAAATFPGLPHRLQLAAEMVVAPDGSPVRFYNDSKSTTPEATRLAVEAFAEGDARHVHLIAGGYDKGASLAPIAQLAPGLAGLYTIGKTGPRIDALARVTTPCGTLERAVEAVLARVEPGAVVLLSPGCASWDQFENYEKRGETFVRLVRASIAGRSASPATP
jgi:UDP-N-acetylmuramoylalanine--D-glutamate ligase